MALDDVLSETCRNYLDLCPITLPGNDGRTCYAPHDWRRASELRSRYGDFTIVVETLNQFAVRATRFLFRSDLGNGQRFIPAGIREMTTAAFEDAHWLVAKVDKAGGFYQVDIACTDRSWRDTGAAAVIHVALVPTKAAC